MLRSSPIRLMALVIMLFALTIVTIRVVGGLRVQASPAMDPQVAFGEITIPVEIIEPGEAPATVEVRVQP